MNAALTVLHSSIEDFINTGFEIETLANDCSFTEGPLWHSSGHYLFSDIPANVIYKIVPGNEKEIYLTNSGTDKPDDEYIRKEQAGSNGLAFDQDGSLIICQHGSHRISKYQNELKPFITEYKGKPFNSPNDLILHSNGKLFFSDPPYGLKDQKLNPEKFQPVAGVYCWSNGDLHLICDKYQYPNGVCLSPAEDLLYICSNKEAERFVSAYHPETLEFVKILAEENGDGIECDPAGNIYLCSNDGIVIINEAGERLAILKLPAIAANITWGGEAKKDLFITARENVFLIRNFLR